MTVSRLGRAELEPLVDELVRRYRQGVDPTRVSLRSMSAATLSAIADLLGSDRGFGVNANLPIDRLAQAVGLAGGAELRAAVEQLRGPILDERARRRAAADERDALWDWLLSTASDLDLAPPEAIAAWVERLRAQGPRGGVEVHRGRLESALRLLSRLPADGIGLATMANDITRNSHALDGTSRLAAVVLDLVALRHGMPLAVDAGSRRSLWELEGVVPDPYSSTVLSLGVATDAPDPIGSLLSASATVGEPVVLTLSQLRRWPLQGLPAEAELLVVENPSIVLEAARSNWMGPPIVCSSGRPTVAVVTLLRQLGSRGATLLQHADFDPTGVAITAWLALRAGTTPWKMSADDYTAAAIEGPTDDRFSTTVCETSWDPRLADAMQSIGIPVYEEQLRSAILDGFRR